MKYTVVTFKKFTTAFIREFSDKFRYLETPVQIYTLESLFTKNIALPGGLNYIHFRPGYALKEHFLGFLIENQGVLDVVF